MTRSCPACLSDDSDLKYEENIERHKLDEFAFSSRKRPELMHRELHECTVCRTLFTPELVDYKELEAEYRNADFDSADMADDAAETYASNLHKLGLIEDKHIMDIGTGDGAFLIAAKKRGATLVFGVEPSDKARESAPLEIQGQIWHGAVEDLMGHDEKYDLVTLFMTIEHVADPVAVANYAMKMLRPGGTFAIVGHDRLSLVNKFLGKKSPIFDIEHIQIFTKLGIEKYLIRAGFIDVRAKHFKNEYPLHYWLRLAPIPKGIKNSVESSNSKMLRKSIALNVGNVLATGKKPT